MSTISINLHTEQLRIVPANHVYSWLDLTHYSNSGEINANVKVYFDSIDNIDTWIDALLVLKKRYGSVLPISKDSERV